MGLFNKLKAPGDPRYGIDSTIETQARIVESLRRKFPEQDMNAWLAYAMRGRPGFGGREEIYYFKRTVVFAAALPEIAMPTRVAYLARLRARASCGTDARPPQRVRGR